MSRIEEALEQALKMREEGARQAPAQRPAPPVALRPVEPKPETKRIFVDPSKIHPNVVTIRDPLSAAAEQYRKLRARILSATRDDFRNTLLVSSSDVGEGKTITSVNLAVALAQELDHTVLIVDADLRRPSVHQCLGIEPGRGLSDYLSGAASLEDVLVHTGFGKLVALPAGTIPPNPAELLASNRMKSLVEELKYRYKDRYIIFDSSPMLVASDSLPLTRLVDGVIVVVQAERTAEKTAEKTIGLLRGAPVLGVVFNNVPDYLSRHVHPYYYYRYGEPGSNGTGTKNK